VVSAPTSWTFTVPAGAGRYNASYDIWIHNSQAKPANTGGTLELMIWLYKRDTTPIGSQVGTVMLAGTSWEVWYGSNNGFNTVSYIRTTSASSWENVDLKPFFSDAVTRGYAQAAAYLLGIQAGFEIWEGNTNMVTNSYSVSVN
jgi:cellulose 1,4-beta-cellobiosidase